VAALLENTTKKRDCTIAVPLFEALVLPFVPNNNTEAHAVCITERVRERVHLVYTHHGHLSAAMFWNNEFTRFRIAKTKRVRRLFQYVLYLTRPKDIYLQRGLNTAKLLFCAAKVLHFFDICKREGDFFCFFVMIDTKQAQKKRTEVRLYSVYKGTTNFVHMQINSSQI
jgi:hypothetical protein